MVLPEELCRRLTFLAEQESRTVSNMAKVLIQQGVKRYESKNIHSSTSETFHTNTEEFRSALESQKPKRLKGAPRKLKFFKP